MSLDVDQYSRTIYGVFDLLSDIGGLFDILSNIGYYMTVMISFLLSLGLDRIVVLALFSIPNDQVRAKPKHPDDVINNEILNRKPLKLRLCNWAFPRNDR